MSNPNGKKGAAFERLIADCLYEQLDDLWSSVALEWNGAIAERPSDWPETLEQFRKRGLPEVEIVDSLWILASKPSMPGRVSRWRYFCGINWRKLDKLQDAAKALIETEGDA